MDIKVENERMAAEQAFMRHPLGNKRDLESIMRTAGYRVETLADVRESAFIKEFRVGEMKYIDMIPFNDVDLAVMRGNNMGEYATKRKLLDHLIEREEKIKDKMFRVLSSGFVFTI